MARLERDDTSDAVYVYLEEGAEVARTVRLPGKPIRTVDYDASGRAIGVEFLRVSHGIDLDDVPERKVILRLADEQRLKVFA